MDNKTFIAKQRFKKGNLISVTFLTATCLKSLCWGISKTIAVRLYLFEFRFLKGSNDCHLFGNDYFWKFLISEFYAVNSLVNHWVVVSQLMCPRENIDFNLKSTWFKMFVIFNLTLGKDLHITDWLTLQI